MRGPYELPVPGEVIGGRYRVVRVLGNGGMGVVFEAVHQRLQQSVAVKILRPELAQSQEFLVRFDREARAAARLRSPHAVRIFDVDTTPENLTYMVMELLEGNDLADELQRTPIATRDLADWIVQCCAALREAHGKGVVHRDLKPANIFLANGPGGRIAKILDFGISKFLGEGTPFSLRGAAMEGATGATWGGLIGTPEYMAPEQIRARGIVDHRADIWALGMVLYRALARRSPFAGASSAEHMLAVVADPAIPFEDARPDLPLELAAVVMTALEKDPADRYQSAEELASALAPFGSGRTPLGARDSLPDDERRDATRSTPSLRPVEDRMSDTIRAASPFDLESTRADRRLRSSDLPLPSAPLPISAAPAPLPPPAPLPVPKKRGRRASTAVVALVVVLAASLGVYAFTHAAPPAPAPALPMPR